MGFQVTFDAGDPEALGLFWAEILGYRTEPPPPGFDTWEDALTALGIPPEDQDNQAYAIVDPEGKGPRIFLQKVPEKKTAKNRVHLDVNVTSHDRPLDERKELIAKEVERAAGLGATRVREVDEPLGYCVVMRDPEGNEFCLQ